MMHEIYIIKVSVIDWVFLQFIKTVGCFHCGLSPLSNDKPMNFKYSLLTLFLVGVLFQGRAQDSFDTNINVIPPSPNVSDMNKGVEFPVSYYTGSANVEIPIHTISLPQIDLPISLTYRTSGLRVEDYASWVGAGWTLQAGGNVSRTVKGLPDELNETHRSGWFTARSSGLFTSGSINFDTIYSCYSTETPFPPTTPADPLTRIDSIAYGWIDTEPDLYYFSTPSGGGKFVFDQEYNLKPLQEDDFSILAPLNLAGANKWTITGPDGSKYIFEDQESTTSSSACGRNLSAYNDPMTHVSAWQLNQIINAGDTIFFHYESEPITYSRKVTSTAKFGTSVSQTLPLSSCGNNVTVTSQRLSAITTSYGDSISFIEYFDDRVNLDNSYALQRIEVRKNGSKVKQFDLTHAYFGNHNKLKLTKFQEVTTISGNSIPAYEFEYYSYGTFPAISSNSIDYWGYYNGSTGGLFPQYKDAFNHVNRFSTANRNPSINHARVGSLKSIKYPTGGKVTFDYELHEHHDPAYSKTYIYEAEADGVIGEATPTSQLTTFTVGANCSATMTKNVTLNAVDNLVELQKKVNGVFVSTTLSASGNRLSLPAGEYALYAYNSDPNKNAYISIEFEQEEAFNVPTGGLRIERITEEDPDTGSGTIRNFVYENSSGNSSGVLFSPIKMGGKTSVYVPGEVFGFDCTDDPAIEYIEMNAYSAVSMDTYSGSHIGYSRVTEKFSPYQTSGIPQMGNGKIEYVYHNQAAPISSKFPFVQLTDLTHKNGKLLEKTIYSQSDLQTYERIQREQYSYTEETINTDVTRGFVLSRYKSKFCFTCSDGSLSADYSLMDYTYRRKWFRLNEFVRTQYHGTDSIRTLTTYAYDALADHLFPISEEVSKSDSSKIKTAYTRAVSPANLLGVDRFHNSAQISGMKRTLLGRLPTTISRWYRDNSGTGQFENVSTITYANNRPIHQLARDGTEVIYLWGYANAYPVAQILHATQAEVQALITSTYQGYLDEENPSRASMRSLFQHLRSNLPNGLVTGYVYERGRGVSEVSDPNGEKRSYSYDGFSRLKDIKDDDGNYLSAFEYLYQPEN